MTKKGNPILHVDPHFVLTDKFAGLPTIPTRDNATQNFLSYMRQTTERKISAGKLMVTSRLDTGLLNNSLKLTRKELMDF